MTTTEQTTTAAEAPDPALHPFNAPDADECSPIGLAMRRIAYLESLPFAGLSRASSTDPEQVERRMLIGLLEEIGGEM